MISTERKTAAVIRVKRLKDGNSAADAAALAGSGS
jgi:gamma-glutamyltranspeptidase